MEETGQSNSHNREKDNTYRILFEAAKDAIIITDIRDGKIIECNKSALEMFGCRYNDILGKSIFIFTPEKQPDGSDSKGILIQKVNYAIKGIPQSFE